MSCALLVGKSRAYKKEGEERKGKSKWEGKKILPIIPREAFPSATRARAYSI